jgi:DNA repair protein RecO (recombination protein O)
MEWTDTGIVISARLHGETSTIVEALTRNHGRHLGLVRGGASRLRRAEMQPGNTMELRWRARLSEHLGNFQPELLKARAGELIAEPASLAGLNAFRSMVAVALPEREPHAGVFDAAEILLDAMPIETFEVWAPLYVRWEIGLLGELGFGLDLTQCAATGVTDDLTFVSPRSGCAVSSRAGEAYKGRLFPLPGFLLEPRGSPIGREDIVSGLKLSGHFLQTRVLEPHNSSLPSARLRLEEMAARESLRTA